MPRYCYVRTRVRPGRFCAPTIMSLATPNQTRPHGPTEARHPVLPPSASKENEPTFYRCDIMMALFINPCECATYDDPLLQKRPSRKKRFCETNLILGNIGKLGKFVSAHRKARRRVRRPPRQRRFKGSIPMATALALCPIGERTAAELMKRQAASGDTLGPGDGDRLTP